MTMTACVPKMHLDPSRVPQHTERAKGSATPTEIRSRLAWQAPAAEAETTAGAGGLEILVDGFGFLRSAQLLPSATRHPLLQHTRLCDEKELYHYLSYWHCGP
jgi:hypothetical protein